MKNGGNVTINADGTMDAEGSPLGFNIKFGTESFTEFMNTMNSTVLANMKPFVLTLNFHAYSPDDILYRCSGTVGKTGWEGDSMISPCNIVAYNQVKMESVTFCFSEIDNDYIYITTADQNVAIEFNDTRNTESSFTVTYLLAYR